ncbi:phytochelatin synthase family protein [Pseudoxanthomonas beigongshangi]
MKRGVVVRVVVALTLGLAAGAGMAWNEYLRKPAPEALALPDTLIPLASPEGQRLLAESGHRTDYDELMASFVPQTRKAYCGVASAITVLNAAGVDGAPRSASALFAPAGVRLSPLKVSFSGMSLRALAELLRAHGADAEAFPASATDLASFRDLARANLGREGDYLLVNYQRDQLGQVRMGHISPVAAYHGPSDRLLILDVAAHKYPPVWADLDHVWQAMRAPLNARTTTTRGFVVVRQGDDG